MCVFMYFLKSLCVDWSFLAFQISAKFEIQEMWRGQDAGELGRADLLSAEIGMISRGYLLYFKNRDSNRRGAGQTGTKRDIVPSCPGQSGTHSYWSVPHVPPDRSGHGPVEIVFGGYSFSVEQVPDGSTKGFTFRIRPPGGYTRLVRCPSPDILMHLAAFCCCRFSL